MPMNRTRGTQIRRARRIREAMIDQLERVCFY